MKKTKLIALKSQGLSMYPLLWDQDTVYINTSNKKLLLNDIIVIEKSTHFITHRIIYIDPKKKYLITKGDNNLVSDDPISFKEVFGKLVKIKRNNKFFEPESLYLLQSTLYFKELIKLNHQLSKSKLRFVYLKGLPLHLFYEKTYTRRLYSDCDLLIDPTDWQTIHEIFLKLGFQLLDSSFSLEPKVPDKVSQCSYAKTLGSFNIEFDVHFNPGFLPVRLKKTTSLYQDNLLSLLHQDFLQNRHFIRIQGYSFPLLDPYHQVIYLALNIFHHNFRGYARYAFLAVIINKLGLKPIKLAHIIKNYQLENYLYPVFWFLRSKYQIRLSHSFFHSIKPLQIKFIQKHILPMDIFLDTARTEAGILRFKYAFYLSPRNFAKFLIFFDAKLLKLIFFFLYRGMHVSFFRLFKTDL